MEFFDNIKTLMGNNKSQPTAPPIVKPRKKILIVEDEKPLSDALKIKLETAGYDVLQAENGQIGLDMIQSQHPFLVLLDLIMPVMDGKVMLHKLREIPEFKVLPIIVLTNEGDIDSMKETWQYQGAYEFLIKSSVSLDEIVEKVKDITG